MSGVQIPLPLENFLNFSFTMKKFGEKYRFGIEEMAKMSFGNKQRIDRFLKLFEIFYDDYFL